MTAIVTVSILSAVFGGALWMLYMKEEAEASLKKNFNAMCIIGVLAAGFIAHVIGALCYYGFESDMGCFSSWSQRVFAEGLRNFYADGQFHDYPPGYVYVMYVLGAIKKLFMLDSNGNAWVLTLKLPAIIADMIVGYFVYKFAKRKFGDGLSSAFAALIVLNPTTILNSSLWGQVDSILALFCLLAVYYAAEKKMILSFAWFAAGVLVKPQALFFTPVLIFSVIEEVWLSGGFKKDKLIKYVLSGLGAVVAMFILFMPFGASPMSGIKTVLSQYVETMKQYPSLSLNAFNVYSAVGQNWGGLTGISKLLGYGVIVLVVAYSGYVFFKSKSPAKHYMTALILVFGVFMLAVKMHERYAFPGIFMLVMALVAVPNTKSFAAFGLYSLSQFINIAWVLFFYDAKIETCRSPFVITASLINVILLVAMVCYVQKDFTNYKESVVNVSIAKNVGAKQNVTSGTAQKKTIGKKDFEFEVSEKFEKITRWDVIAIAVIGIVYSVIALYNLGNMFAPQNGVDIKQTEISIDLGSEKEIAKTEFFLGPRELNSSRSLDFEYLDSNKESVYTDSLTSGSVFYWTSCDVNKSARYIRITTNSTDDEPLEIKELCFLDDNGEKIEPVKADGCEALFDEQDMFVEGKSFMAETYFDEIYHARTAYEFIHHLSVYEWTHPPLGKVLMGIGILIFGMVPFGWRIVGTVVGILMIPVIYIFAKRMLKYRWLSIITCVLFTFDFMHFAQTRLATIDVYVTFFIMLMYYFMYKYYKITFYDTSLKKTLIPLGLSGFFFGCAVASKWTGLYAGAGLAIIFFYAMYKRYNEYRHALWSPKGETNGLKHSDVIESFRKNLIITLAFCVVMFIVIPAVIYTCSYIPYMKTPSGHGLKTIFENMNSMYTYHSKTVVDSTHPYSSHWYEWPIMYRPIWYFSNTLDNGLKQGISAFGNPLVWWLGIGALAYMAALTIVIPLKKRNYYFVNKYVYLGVYAIIFAFFCVTAYFAGANNEKLQRLFICVLMYSVVFVGIFALVLTCDEYIKQTSNSIALFLLIGYMLEIIPWMWVVRTTYIYHYFPAVPFTVLMLGYSIKTFYENSGGKCAVRNGAIVYAGLVVMMFIMFYPVLSGHPCSYDYAKEWLKWFDSWVLL